MSRNVQYLVVHCADTPASMDIGRREIARWHRERGWRDIGYHYVIRRNGALERGRHLNRDHLLNTQEMGAHVAGHNAVSVGVCLVGGRGDDGQPSANYTSAQYRRLRELLHLLSRQFPGAQVVGHADLDDTGKTCPNFNVSAWWEERVPDLPPEPEAVDQLVARLPAENG